MDPLRRSQSDESYEFNLDLGSCQIRGSFSNQSQMCHYIIDSLNQQQACRLEPARGLVKRVYDNYGCPAAIGVHL